MDDLIAFLTARLDEDEAAATSAGGEAWRSESFVGVDRTIESVYATGNNWIARCGITDQMGGKSQAIHIARHDPARVLREVEAKRAILGRHMPHEPAFGGPACNWCSDDVDDRPQLAKERWPCPDARSLAAVYSDHPDYRAEWAPVTAGR